MVGEGEFEAMALEGRVPPYGTGGVLAEETRDGGAYISALKFQEIEVVPVQKSRPDRCPDEAIVVFPNKEMRDRVRSHASNLAKLPPGVKAGVRMEILDFLQANFRALEPVSYTHLTLPTIYSV